MIDKITKGVIPYVDTTPGDGQLRIGWIKNGERLSAASTQTSSDGVYNRAPLNIQQNVVQLDEDQAQSFLKINEIVDAVNIIQDNLGVIGDNTIIDQINANSNDILAIKQDISKVETNLAGVLSLSESTSEKLGHRYLKDNTTRTVYGDLYWIKTELGAYPGFDTNGNSVPSSTGSGLKYRFSQVNQTVSLNTQRITALENSWAQSDVGQLTSDLYNLRMEVGNTNRGTGIPIYTRLTAIENTLGGGNDDVDQIKIKIDFSNPVSIASRVTLNESATSSLANTMNTPVTGVLSRLGAVEQKIGDVNTQNTILHDINRNTSNIATIAQILGADGSSGIQGDISDINAAIGSIEEPSSINGRLHILQTNHNQMSLSLNDVVSRVGDENSGLVAANVLMSTDLYGNAAGITQLERDGIKKTVKESSETLQLKLDKPLAVGRWYYENGVWVKATNIMVAVEKKDFQITTTETSKIIPFVDFDQTVANGCIFESGQIKFTDGGLVNASIEIETSGLLETDNLEISIAHTSSGITSYTNLQEFTLRSNGRLYARNWLYNVILDDTIAIYVKALDSSSAKSITIGKMSAVIVPA
ncbi:fibritin neck whisker [Aeromonas phage 60AhydR15PP]|uniref:Fibritin neck whiskers protein n=1 Tax=Aeromonas phage 60AhydR15PP TaxID=2163979 RepID=A0A2S1PG49_9CAUD|nr:fibritin neck whisker [Aeromonas phage 60AhydR15PP]AWH15540.1 fibritin neck whiskers protein [Aeromonas phage 60AhydR15PP]